MRFLDQMHNNIQLPDNPQRIISLVPSITELLFDLGLDEEIVGVTDYCILPEEKVRTRTKIGGVKKFKFQIIDDIRPDLIIGNREENYPEGIYRLQERYPVWMSDITSITDALWMIKEIGTIVNRSSKAGDLIREIKEGLDNLPKFPSIPTAYLIWKDPFMVAARQTFINEMMKKCGFRNIFNKMNRYPKIELNKLVGANLLLLSSEPYSFEDSDVNFFVTNFPGSIVKKIDGKIFSWYGSHMRKAPGYFINLRGNL